MKVKLEEGYKERYTLTDLEAAKKVIAYEREDESALTDWATYAVGEITRNCANTSIEKVLFAEAYTAKNARVWDAYGEGTRDMDVEIYFVAKSYWGFIEGAAYLTDIWKHGAEPYREHTWFNYYHITDKEDRDEYMGRTE